MRDALTATKKALHRRPDSVSNHLSLAVIYTLLDRQEKAEGPVKKALEIMPSVSVDLF
jgi:Tfp pilus assembly protein PilF